MTDLMQASNQWATRPPDERYWSVDELAHDLALERERTVSGTCQSKDLRVEPVNGDLMLKGERTHAELNNWSFGQLCSRAGAPGSYLQQLPATLAAQNLNYGLKQQDGGETKLLLKRTNGTYTARALTSGIYSRIHDYQIVERLQYLARIGWRTPPARPAMEDPRARPATQQDLLNDQGMLSVSVGDLIAPAGVYRGDRDMWVFMVNESARLDDGTDEGLSRGFFVWNSEVGARSFGLMTFLYRHVCGNHIVWGAKGVKEIRLRHVGTASARATSELRATVQQYADSSAQGDEQKIRRAQTFRIAQSKADVIDELFGKRITTRQLAASAIELAEQHPEDGDPLSAWGLAQGITRAAQELPNADARVETERAAGKILEIAF